MIWTTIPTVGFALATLALALRAACLWWEASRTVDLGEPVASISDVPELHIMRAQVELSALKIGAAINRQAALWTGWAAIMGAMTSIWGDLAPLFIH